MPKVVINACYGGFGVSPEAALWMWEKGYTELATPVGKYFSDLHSEERWGYKSSLAEWRNYLAQPPSSRERGMFLTPFTPDEQSVLDTSPEDRAHPLLIQCIEALGRNANGACASLKIVDVPDGVEWEIDEYDGNEHVAQKHETWS